MKTINEVIYVLTFLVLLSGCKNYEYLGQKPPKDIPQIFAPELISLPNRKEEVITFSTDLKEIYYAIEYYPDPKPSFIMFTKYDKGQWSEPDTASFSKGRRTSEPFMAFNGKRIYYFANNVSNQKGILDICYSYRKNGTWSEPISLNSPPNFKNPNFSLHPCIIADSSLYFSSYSGEVCKSKYENNAYSEVTILPSPINYENLEGVECWGDPYVSSDERFMIFRSNRAGGFGGSDLYISFINEEQEWTKPQNLGSKINTSFDELGGDITPDGKYLTFGRNGDLYWVSTRFMEELRKEGKK